jgi:hypothetical protein
VKQVLTINSTSVKTPKAFSVEISDLEGETHRNAKGDLVRDRLATKRKLTVEWGPLTQSEVSTILATMTNAFFTIQYPDPAAGVTTKTFYVAARTTPMYRNIGGSILWINLAAVFIEK